MIARFGARIAIVLVMSGVIVAAALAIGHTPLASAFPATFLTVGEQRQGGGPPAGVTQRGQAAGASDAAAPPAAASAQSPFNGRNAPSLQRGLPEELAYVAMFAGLCAAVAFALRWIRPRRRSTRSQMRARVSSSGSGAAQLEVAK